MLLTCVFQSNPQAADPVRAGLQRTPDPTALQQSPHWESQRSWKLSCCRERRQGWPRPGGRRGRDTGHLPSTGFKARLIFLLKTHYRSVPGKTFTAITGCQERITERDITIPTQGNKSLFYYLLLQNIEIMTAGCRPMPRRAKTESPESGSLEKPSSPFPLGTLTAVCNSVFSPLNPVRMTRGKSRQWGHLELPQARRSPHPHGDGDTMGMQYHQGMGIPRGGSPATRSISCRRSSASPPSLPLHKPTASAPEPFAALN